MAAPTSSSSDGQRFGANCTSGQNLAFLGATTGPAGALGQNMVGGIKLALDDYNKENPDCKVGLKIFDSQGDPDKATPLATQIVGDNSIVGLVGPGFSGESLATGKTFAAAGLPSISPSATNVTITQQGWTTWHRVIGNDSAQGAAAATYLNDTAKRQEGLRGRRRLRLRQGPRQLRQDGPRLARSPAPTRCRPGRPTSPRP